MKNIIIYVLIFLFLSVFSLKSQTSVLFKKEREEFNGLEKKSLGVFSFRNLNSPVWIIDLPNERVSFSVKSLEGNLFKGESYVSSSSISLLSNRFGVIGLINHNNKAYELIAMKSDDGATLNSSLRELSIPHNECLVKDVKHISPQSSRISDASDNEVRILIAYTPRAYEEMSDGLFLTIAQSVALTNQSYIDSDIDQRVVIAGIIPVQYTESDESIEIDLENFQNNHDGVMDEIHRYRYLLQADVCALIGYDFRGGAGMAAALGANFESAFFCSDAKYSSSNYTFAHELGHLYGAKHNRHVQSVFAPKYAHGFIQNGGNDDPQWRTIMAYPYLRSTRIGYWSNPRKWYKGDVMGTLEYEDNARIISERRAMINNLIRTSPNIAFSDVIRHEIPYEYNPTATDILVLSDVEYTEKSLGNISSGDRVCLKDNVHLRKGSYVRVYIKEKYVNSYENSFFSFDQPRVDWSVSLYDSNKLRLERCNNSHDNENFITINIISESGVIVHNRNINVRGKIIDYRLPVLKNGEYYIIVKNSGQIIERLCWNVS